MYHVLIQHAYEFTNKILFKPSVYCRRVAANALSLAVPWDGLVYVIVSFPGRTQMLPNGKHCNSNVVADCREHVPYALHNSFVNGS